MSLAQLKAIFCFYNSQTAERTEKKTKELHKITKKQQFKTYVLLKAVLQKLNSVVEVCYSRAHFCMFFNSRTAIAQAVFGRLLVFIASSRFLLRPYDVTTTSNLLYVHSFMQFQLECVCDVFLLLMERVFLFIRVINYLVTLDFLT